jgi:pyruvate dehydrogenase (quinone)
LKRCQSRDVHAAAAGIHALRVEQPADVRSALEDAFSHPGPALVDLVTDPNVLSIPPHITATEVKGFPLAAGKLDEIRHFVIE